MGYTASRWRWMKAKQEMGEGSAVKGDGEQAGRRGVHEMGERGRKRGGRRRGGERNGGGRDREREGRGGGRGEGGTGRGRDGQREGRTEGGTEGDRERDKVVGACR